MRQKVEFKSGGRHLSGALEAPESAVRCYALFAHCFTCGKDALAASRIARALTSEGIAVLRFDFTGLGNSDGDFANTNFSSNIQDLRAAVDFLRESYEAPRLLIGHSLGGAAVLAMAADVPECSAVATIGAPHRPDQVLQLLSGSLEEIREQGEAEIRLGERAFSVRHQFLEDLENFKRRDLGKLRRALLVMHSPLDDVVPIGEAEKIYREAKHPKSFISLDNANHLLTLKRDTEYAAANIAAWASRYLPEEHSEDETKVPGGHVRVEEKNHVFTQHVYTDSHHWLADEPRDAGGDNAGPDPYEHLLAALGTCTAMTLRMYARRKEIPLAHVAVELRHDREYLRDCEGCEQTPTQLEVIERWVTLVGELSQEQRQRLLEIADKCPVHRTLHSELEVRTKAVE